MAVSLKPLEQIVICQHVARLVRAKLPLAGELSRIANKSGGSSETTLRTLDEQLSKGKSLAQILAGDDSQSSRILAACIDMGESSGRLADSLEGWAALYMARARDSRMMRVAMIYPTLLILITLASLGFVIWQLIPEYRETYAMFSAELPQWLEMLVWVREQYRILMLAMLLATCLPVVGWVLWRRSLDRNGLPRGAAPRLRVQALATQLLQLGVAGGLPLNQLIRLGVLATGGRPPAADKAFELIRQHRPIPHFPREASMLLSALHAGILSHDDASRSLSMLTERLSTHADRLAARAARWLPMLVALIIGGLTIAIYVFLIYLPWIILLKQIVQPITARA